MTKTAHVQVKVQYTYFIGDYCVFERAGLAHTLTLVVTAEQTHMSVVLSMLRGIWTQTHPHTQTR